MRPIAIIPLPGDEPAAHLNDAITYLRDSGIECGSAVVGQGLGLIWVAEENVLVSVEKLRGAAFEAIAVAETD